MANKLIKLVPPNGGGGGAGGGGGGSGGSDSATPGTTCFLDVAVEIHNRYPSSFVEYSEAGRCWYVLSQGGQRMTKVTGSCGGGNVTLTTEYIGPFIGVS